MEVELNNIINLQEVEAYERTCPSCGKITKNHSVDGGLSSIFHGECGHVWVCCPFAKNGKEIYEEYIKNYQTK
jgi:hypothetical protein